MKPSAKRTVASPETAAALRRRAEARMRESQRRPVVTARHRESEHDGQRLYHELQVHQVELELQNGELQETRDRLEAQLDRYTDLYDFAPVGYVTLDEQGRILEINLTGATLLGVDRGRLLNDRLQRFIVGGSRPVFHAFLKRVFGGMGLPFCEAALEKKGGSAFWAAFRGACVSTSTKGGKCCRLTFADVTARKQAADAERRVQLLAASNRKLEKEVLRRQAGEESLRKSEQHQRQMLEQACQMQEQLKQLARQLLQVQEEERKRISRELHDVIAQTLTGINFRLVALRQDASQHAGSLDRNIARTQRLVESAVDIVHRFARDLRPPVLDDLGLLPAMQALVKRFAGETGIRVTLTACDEVERLTSAKRAVLYRVAQEALTNVNRHAGARRVDVTFHRGVKCMVMELQDDGKAFDADAVLRTGKRKRLGLIGMRERVEMVGGMFSVESAPGLGTRIQAQIPLKHVSRGEPK